MNSRKLLVPVALASAMMVSCEGNFPETQLQTDDQETVRIAQIGDELKTKLFAELVPDSVIEQSIDDFFFGNNSRFEKDAWFDLRRGEEAEPDFGNTYDGIFLNTIARQNVLQTELCPAFDFGQRCWSALYASYDGGEWFAQNDGIDVEVLPILKEARTQIIATARDYLADPENLLHFFNSKKEVIVRTLRKHIKTPDELKIFNRWLSEMETALAVSQQPEFQNTYHIYLSQEEESRAAYKELHERMKPEMDKNGSASPGDYPVENDASYLAHLAEVETEKLLISMTPDLGTSQFAARRQAEGGDALVDAWRAIVEETRNLAQGLFQAE